MRFFIITLLAAFGSAISASAATVTYSLEIAETTLAPAGKPVRALTLNGGVPGPVLRFHEGDTARVTVRNLLKEESTSIHWHGLLVPNEMDGVPYVTTPPIQPGTEHVFEFPLRQSGTYWYHSHTGLQEQRGVYGSIVITPRGGEPVVADHDHVVLLSDWTNEHPKEVMRTLMRGSSYYSIRKGSAQSLVGAYRADRLGEYFRREKSRMPPMDVSDVYYDAFLANGEFQQSVAAKPGETVRLRLINGSASTYFYVYSAAGPLRIVAADGPAVEPVAVDRILMGVAETYDVLLNVPSEGSWEVRAVPVDNTGHASIFVGEGEPHLAGDMPGPELYSMDAMLAAGMSTIDPEMAEDDTERPQAPYAGLRSLEATTLPPDAPVREMELRLTGDMTRYIWGFNGKTFAEEPTVPVKEGEVLRITMINDTMMHHPIHLHGHFFRVLNAQGDHSPLKHTIDVPPMGRRTIEFLANERGDWLMHCHLLYHMGAGMMRIFSYRQAEDSAYQPGIDPDHLGMSMFTLEGTVLNTMSVGHAHLMRGRETFGVHWHHDYDGHEEQDDGRGLHTRWGYEHDGNEFQGKYEIDLHWNHYFGPNLSTTLGYRLSNEEGTGDRVFGQLDYRLPYLVEARLALDSRGDARVGLGKTLQITPRLSSTFDTEYDTNSGFEWSTYSHILLNKEFSLTGGYDSEHGWGAGLSFRF
jgi:FtsP/CotA-like multicopper oxidase with cupredoxin domain